MKPIRPLVSMFSLRIGVGFLGCNAAASFLVGGLASSRGHAHHIHSSHARSIFFGPRRVIGRSMRRYAAAGGSPEESPKVTFREAEPSDLETLLAWDEADHVKEHAGDNDFNEWNWVEELERQPSWRQQWIAMVDVRQSGEKQPKPIGVVQIIDPALEDSHYWGSKSVVVNGEGKKVAMEPHRLKALDIWIGELDYIGKGYGTEMMKLVLDFCFGENKTVEAVLVDPMADNLRAHNFYQNCGFQPVGEQYFGPDHCLVHCIERADWEMKNV